MRKFLIGIFIVSTISIIYVFQQARLLEYSYLANNYKRSLALLIDQNKHLQYNVTRLETPANLEHLMLAKKNTEVAMPRTWYEIKVEEKAAGFENITSSVNPIINTGRILLSIFSLDTEAVAKESGE